MRVLIVMAAPRRGSPVTMKCMTRKAPNIQDGGRTCQREGSPRSRIHLAFRSLVSFITRRSRRFHAVRASFLMSKH